VNQRVATIQSRAYATYVGSRRDVSRTDLVSLSDDDVVVVVDDDDDDDEEEEEEEEEEAVRYSSCSCSSELLIRISSVTPSIMKASGRLRLYQWKPADETEPEMDTCILPSVTEWKRNCKSSTLRRDTAPTWMKLRSSNDRLTAPVMKLAIMLKGKGE
jgi:hypothetical protein